jgi:hypothetical protein
LVTQAPVLALIKLGVNDTRLLAIVYSAALFALPTALYHLALARARADAVLLLAVLAIVTVVYLPTYFFIIGEYNATYAAATAATTIVLTAAGRYRRDGILLCLLGALCLASYEAMIYLGPLLAALILWSTRRTADDVARLLGIVAALAFLGGAAVSAAAVAEYWDHDYFTRVRAATFDFWQNLQFVIPFTGLAAFAFVSLLAPSWLRSLGPPLLVAVVGAVLLSTPWFRQLIDPEAMLFPPAHYVARTAAGGVLAAILAAMWLHVAWRRRRPALLVHLGEPAVTRRLTLAMFALLLVTTVPDLVLTRLWIGYLDYFRGLVTGHAGLVRANDLPMRQWPYRLFSQDWTYPALSALVAKGPGQGVVVVDKDYRTNPPFEPSCGTVPRLRGYGWR